MGSDGGNHGATRWSSGSCCHIRDPWLCLGGGSSSLPVQVMDARTKGELHRKTRWKNTGIGKVVMLCRNIEKAEEAAQEIRKATEGKVVVHKLDLASLASVRECAEQLGNSLEKIDILINNAGVMACPEMRTQEGFEMQIGTNHFGHFLLTNLVMPLLKKAAPHARIVNVSSLAHTRGQIQWDDINFEKTPYDAIKAYGQSKLANILFTKELARKGEGSGVNAYALHPGVINTELGRHLKDTFGPFVCLWKVAMPFIKT